MARLLRLQLWISVRASYITTVTRASEPPEHRGTQLSMSCSKSRLRVGRDPAPRVAGGRPAFGWEHPRLAIPGGPVDNVERLSAHSQPGGLVPQWERWFAGQRGDNGPGIGQDDVDDVAGYLRVLLADDARNVRGDRARRQRGGTLGAVGDVGAVALVECHSSMMDLTVSTNGKSAARTGGSAASTASQPEVSTPRASAPRRVGL